MVSKKDIVEEISTKFPKIPKTTVNSIVSEVFDEIKKKVMVEEQKVQIQKFGSFEKKITNRKLGKDPVTGEELVVRKNESMKFVGSKK